MKIKVAAVNYLNTKPLLYGIKNHPVFEQIELIEDYPAKIADMLLNLNAQFKLLATSWKEVTMLAHTHG